MFCLFNSCIEEKRRQVSHNRHVTFNEEVIVVNIDKIQDFEKSPNHPVILPEKSLTNNIEKEEPIFTLS